LGSGALASCDAAFGEALLLWAGGLELTAPEGATSFRPPAAGDTCEAHADRPRPAVTARINNRFISFLLSNWMVRG
jgi:hypothetical protein